MSDDLPIPPTPPKGSNLPPPPPELVENTIISDESEDSFEDIKNSIENILSEVSEKSPPGLDIQPPPLPPGLDIQPPPLPPGLDIQPPPLPPSLDIKEISQTSEVLPHESITETSKACLLYTSPSPRDQRGSRMPSSA